jgi:CBS domain containing-hemolysin-like protein
VSTGLALGVTVTLLILNGFFVAAEFALLTARRHRLEQLVSDRRRGSRAALAGSRELSMMLAAAQLGITMASLGLGIVSEPALAQLFDPYIAATGLPEDFAHVLAVTVALAIIVFLHMVVGEMAPKSWALTHPETTALSLAPAFRLFAMVFRPVLVVMNASANGLVRLCGVEPRDELTVGHTPSDLAMIVEQSAGQGALQQEEGRLLRRALGLAQLDARAVMVPRGALVAVPAGADAEQVEQVARDSGRSRLPVHGADLDDVLGVLHVKDLLLLEDADRAAATAGSLARPALRAAETEAADDLLLRMRELGQHLCVVVDEYGGVSGVVSLEDLVEELIGDFDDETDPVRVDGGSGIPAGLRPDEVERLTGLSLPEGEFDTLAGWVLLHLRRVAVVGDVVRADGLVVRVLAVDGARIDRVSMVAADDEPVTARDADSGTTAGP